MTYYENKYRTDSNRWKYWNYSAPGSYFLTTCIHNRQEILGKIIDGKMILSAEGKIVQNQILQIPEYNNRIIFDEWVIMPNHIHFLLTLGDFNFINEESKIDTRKADLILQQKHDALIEKTIGRDFKPDEIKVFRNLRRQMLIPKIMGKFQTLTSIKINELDGINGRRNWQSSYHDHVIRIESAYFRIKNYIRNNPKKWEADKFFGGNSG